MTTENDSEHEAVPLDPDEGPTAWVETTRQGTIKLMEGTDPDDPVSEVNLNLRELRKALHAVEPD